MSRHRKGFRSSDSYIRRRVTTPNVRRVDGVNIHRAIGGWIFQLEYVDGPARFRLDKATTGWTLLRMSDTNTGPRVIKRARNFQHAIQVARESLHNDYRIQ
jgi:hypothetical protein